MSSSTIEVSQLYETGNRKFFASTLNPDGSYGAKEYHEGLMEIKIDFTNEITDINADDNPSYIRLNTPISGSGTVKFAVLPYEVYSKFFDVEIDKNGVIVIKGKGKTKEVAFGYYSTVGDGSESMFTLYRAVFSLPSLSATSFDGKTIRDLTLNVKVYPYDYINSENKSDTVTYTILNSNIHSDIWSKCQEEIYIPDSTLQ